MANIDKRTGKNGKISYRARVRVKGQPTQSATFDRLTDAKHWATGLESDIRSGRQVITNEARRHTLADAIDRYLESENSENEKTSKTKATQLAWWRNELGSVLLANITGPELARARDTLATEKLTNGKSRSPATVVRYMAALSHLFTVAVREWEWLAANPLSKVRKPREPQGRVRALSDDERTRLLEACKQSPSTDLYIAVVLSLSTAARQAEIMSMRWGQVDLKRGVIVLNKTKNKERRSLPLTGHALDLMQQRAKVRRIDTDLVFPGRNPESPVLLRKPWVAAMAEASITDFRWHDLRHSAASYLAMNGATLAEIADVLGHKTLQMVKRYAHLSESHRSEVVTRMNEAIF